MRGKNDDVAFGRLLLRSGDGSWAEISYEISQRLGSSRV
jgi:type IV secretory pathway VirJ component